jgi:hypothetical protein
MSALSALSVVHKAYRLTDAAPFLGYMLGHASWHSRVLLLLSVIVSIAAFIFTSKIGIQISATSAAIVFLWLRNDAFRRYRAEKHPALGMDIFTNHSQGYRYLVFNEALPIGMKSDSVLLEKLLRLLEQRQRVRNTNAFMRNPAISFLVAALVMLAGALIPKAVDLSLGPVLISVVMIIIALLVMLTISGLWRTREYKDEELTEFVLWLWAGASEYDQKSISERFSTGVCRDTAV